MCRTYLRLPVIALSGFLICLMFIQSAHAATYEQEVLADGPIAYYRFEETEGTQATDSSGNDRHGEYVGGVELGEPGAGPGTGLAPSFDGESGFVQLDAWDLELEQVTFETWVNLEQLAANCCTSIFSPDGWQPGWVHYNVKSDLNLEFALNSGGPNNHNTEPDTFAFDEWAHIASVYDMDEAFVQTYVNGEEVDVFPPDFATPLPATFFVDAQIAAWQNTRFLGGLLDEFAIYDSALSAERILAHFNAATTVGEPGDFDGNGALDGADADALVMAIAAGSNDPAFDLGGDGVVDDTDLTTWVKDLKKTWFGDANLDGEFNSTDFVNVFQSGKFERDEDAGWTEGDWTGDLRFNSTDFVVAFQDGGFEQGPVAAVNAVPEPSAVALLVAGFALFLVPSIRRP